MAEVNFLPFYDKHGVLTENERDKFYLLRRSNRINLPPGALDQLIDEFGGVEKVAEMTGRHLRQVRDRETGVVTIEKRVKEKHAQPRGKANQSQWWADAEGNMTSINIQERAAFMGGQKMVAIISEAASTGISLHADKDVKNCKRRVHFTLELPWAADQAIQQLGRSHRTNQVEPPIYRLLSSGIGGENRFVSSVARRLQSLGALTQGDRRGKTKKEIY